MTPLFPVKLLNCSRLLRSVVRCAPFITQTEVQSQLGRDSPIVLRIKPGLLRLVFDCGINRDASVVAFSDQNVGKRISLVRVKCSHHILSNILRKVKVAGGIRRLLEIIEEQTLLSPNLKLCLPCTHDKAEEYEYKVCANLVSTQHWSKREVHGESVRIAGIREIPAFALSSCEGNPTDVALRIVAEARCINVVDGKTAA